RRQVGGDACRRKLLGIAVVDGTLFGQKDVPANLLGRETAAAQREDQQSQQPPQHGRHPTQVSEPSPASSARISRCSASAARSKSVVSATTTPSTSTNARLARRAISRSCVTRMTVSPSSSFSLRM